MRTGGMPREQWEHGDKEAEDERTREDTLVLGGRERWIQTYMVGERTTSATSG